MAESDKIRLTGVHPALDGDYEIDGDFTKWEYHCIKRLTGLAGMDLVEAFPKGDTDILVALAMVALMRDGKIESQSPWNSEQVTALWNKGDITEVSEKKSDPPAMPASSPENADELSGQNGSSGETSPTSSGSPDEDQNPTGVPV